MDTAIQLTYLEALELQALIAPCYPELEEIDDFEEIKEYLLRLTKLDLSFRNDLIVLPKSIGKLTLLSKLNLSFCDNISTLLENIGNFTQLTELALSFCGNLTTLPESLGNLTQLTTLDLCGCTNLTTLPESLGNLTQLTQLNLSECENITTLPESFGNLTQLTTLDLCGCRNLSTFFESLSVLTQLEKLYLGFCTELTTLPKNLGNLTQLTELSLYDCTNLETLPESIGNLSQLTELDLTFCGKLTTLPESLGNLTQLKKLNLNGCGNLTTLPESFGNLIQIEILSLIGDKQAAVLLKNINNFKQLIKLDLSFCENLTTLPESLGNLIQLTKLSLFACTNLETLPESIGNLSQLTVLDLSFCEKLTTLPENLGNLTQLTVLDLSGCKNLTTLPESLGNLSQLTKLDLSFCEKLTTLPKNLGNLIQLTQLNLSGCKNLTTLPDSLDKLKRITILDLSDCENLKIKTQLNIKKSQLDNISLLSIGNIFYKQKDFQRAKEYYLEINDEKFRFSIQLLYLIAQIKLALIYAKEEEYDNFNRCIDKINETNEEYYVHQVMEKIEEIKDNHQKIYLFNIFYSFFNMRENLLVGKYYSIYEQTFAHYAKPDVAMILLDKKNKFQIASTAQVNDPKEGKVIFDYFNNSEKLKKQQINLKPLNTLSTFIGCFTFNHDSLNQFRLYGKENNKEATGVSVVLNNNFFSYQHDKTLQPKKQAEYSNNDTNKQSSNIDHIYNDKLPLYRCIYLDPEGKLDNQPYIQAACRDKLTFYREKWRNQNDWDEYQEYINDIQENIMEEFSNIETNICELFANINNVKEKEQLIETVSFILLPLSFMVKHSAYQEEQECRIFRFVAPDDKEIKVAPASKRMYIEYSQSMSKYVNKMYLSTGAEQYRNIFEFLTKKISNKIEIRKSKNPFR
ncbi:MAG: hypothetical protein IJV35_04060 [Neisseriaceae bacterium]|nr:hypothetical protein [Neisseriaceae bacterium]